MRWREGGKNSEKDEGAERQRLGRRERRVRGTVHPHSSARQQPPLPGYSSPRAPARSQAWAIHKGRHLEGIDKEDPPTWKTRLRCALNKSADFCEVRERSQLDISDPYKVYRIVSGSARGPGMILPLEVVTEDGSLGNKDPTLPICKLGNGGLMELKLMGW